MTWARMTPFSKWKLKADKLNPSNIDVGSKKILNPSGCHLSLMGLTALIVLGMKATCYT